MIVFCRQAGRQAQWKSKEIFKNQKKDSKIKVRHFQIDELPRSIDLKPMKILVRFFFFPP
jgi:hypothetical protein